MSEDCRIEGYAIVSADGMIADENGHMPDILRNEADLRFFEFPAGPGRHRGSGAKFA